MPDTRNGLSKDQDSPVGSSASPDTTHTSQASSPKNSSSTSWNSHPSATSIASSTSPPSSAPRTPTDTTHLLTRNHKSFVKKYRTEISASTASLCSTLAAYPLDSVKTRMQAYKFPDFTSCVRHTYRTEGVHGFWRGVFAPLASITLVRTVSFSIYQRAKYSYDRWIESATGSSPLVHANTRGAWPSMRTAACFGGAGATSGALITVISCPFELTKLNAQIAVLMEKGVGGQPQGQGVGQAQGQTSNQGLKGGADKKKATGTWGTAKMIMRHRGVMGLYSGFHLHLLRDTIGTAIYFTTYESAKQLLANARGNSPTSPLAVVLAGGLCGLVSWACIYPIDSAKSIYQRNILSAEAGGKAKTAKINFFSRKRYRGLGVSMSRSCLVNAIFFSVFEGVKKWVNGLEVEGEG